jgi:hypothetical protein
LLIQLPTPPLKYLESEDNYGSYIQLYQNNYGR